MRAILPRTYKDKLPRPLGLTLAEVLVAMALFGLVSGIMVQIMRDGIRFFIAHNTALEVQQQCLTALDRIGTELSFASGQTFQHLEDDNPKRSAVIWASKAAIAEEATAAPSVDSEGGISLDDWKKYIGFYTTTVNNKRVVLRQEVAIGPSDLSIINGFKTPRKIPLPDFISNEAGPRRVIARDIVEIKATDTNPTVLSIRSESQDGRFSLEMKSFILMKN